MTTNWLLGDRHSLASDRILDIAGRCFADKGVSATSIADIARAAGCSRPTVYRYFEDGAHLRIAYVHREARRLGARVLDSLDGISDPRERLVAAVQAAVRGVRSDPILSAWFAGENSTVASYLGANSVVIESLALSMVEGAGGTERELRAKWLVRVVLGLLLVPADDEETERILLEKFVAPVVAGE